MRDSTMKKRLVSLIAALALCCGIVVLPACSSGTQESAVPATSEDAADERGLAAEDVPFVEISAAGAAAADTAAAASAAARPAA